MPTDEADRRLEVMGRLRELVREVTELTESVTEPGRYFPLYLEKVTTALAALGGVVWFPGTDGQWTPGFHIRINPQALLEAAPDGAGPFHQAALREAARSAEPLVLAPGQAVPADREADRAINQSAFLLLFAPIVVEGSPAAVLQVFLDGTRSPQAYRGFMEFGAQMARQAAVFLRRRQLNQLLEERRVWSRLLEMQTRVHDSLEPARVAMNLANHGRAILEADRVSVAAYNGRRARVLAISGQDTFDRHGHLAKGLAALGREVCRTDQEVEYAADEPESVRSGRPGRLAEALDQFVAAAECRHALAVALRGATGPIGALVAERVADPPFSEVARGHLRLMAREGGTALDNALAYRSVPLLGLMRAVRWLLYRNPARAALIGAVLAVLIYILGWVKAPLWLDADAQLFPRHQRTIYVETAGIVDRILVKPGDRVRKNDVLLTIRNLDLTLKRNEVDSQRVQTQWRIDQLESQRGRAGRDRSMDETQISGELQQQRAKLASLEREHQLLVDQLERLTLRSPIDGVVTTQDIEEKLGGKPVKTGDAVLKVASTDDWVLRVYVPEDQMGDLLAAHAASDGQPLPVRFFLKGLAGRSFTGQVEHIASAAEVVRDQNVVVVRVRPEALEAEVKPEMEARAKILGGEHPLGYVWFRELIQFVETRLLF